MTGGEVRLGVRMLREVVAVLKRWRRRVLRGVAGGGGWKKGMGMERERELWWGEGRRMVRRGCGGRGIVVGREVEEGVVVVSGSSLLPAEE